MAQIVLAIQCHNEHLSTIREPMQTRCTVCGEPLGDEEALQRAIRFQRVEDALTAGFYTPEKAMAHYKAADAALAREEKAAREAAAAVKAKNAEAEKNPAAAAKKAAPKSAY